MKNNVPIQYSLISQEWSFYCFCFDGNLKISKMSWTVLTVGRKEDGSYPVVQWDSKSPPKPLIFRMSVEPWLIDVLYDVDGGESSMKIPTLLDSSN